MHGDRAAGDRVVLERAPHDRGVGDRAAVVGERGGTGVGERSHFGQLLPALAARDGRHESDRDVRLLGGARAQAAQDVWVVDDGVGVRDREDRAVAAGRGGLRAARDGLLVLSSRSAQVDVRVDEGGCEDEPIRLKDAVLVGPPTLLPPGLAPATHEIGAIADADVVYVLRMQRERMLAGANFVPSLREYTARWGITPDRLRPGQKVMHPGPMNRGIELDARVADSDSSLVVDQVRSGLVVRMAVLYDLLTSGPVAVEAAVEVA